MQLNSGSYYPTPAHLTTFILSFRPTKIQSCGGLLYKYRGCWIYHGCIVSFSSLQMAMLKGEQMCGMTESGYKDIWSWANLSMSATRMFPHHVIWIQRIQEVSSGEDRGIKAGTQQLISTIGAGINYVVWDSSTVLGLLDRNYMEAGLGTV